MNITFKTWHTPNKDEQRLYDKEKELGEKIAQSFMDGEWTVVHTPETYVPYLPFDVNTKVGVAYATSEKYPDLEIRFSLTMPADTCLAEGQSFTYIDCIKRCHSYAVYPYRTYVDVVDKEDSNSSYNGVSVWTARALHDMYSEQQKQKKQKQTLECISKYL